MQILKNIGYILLFVVLGAGLGTGVFYIQKQTHLQPAVEETSAKTATSSTSPATSSSLSTKRTYTNTASGISLTLDPNMIVQPTDLSGYTSPVSGIVLPIQIVQDSTAAVPSGVTLYILSANGANTNSFSIAKNKLVRSIVTQTASQSFDGQTTSLLPYVKKQFGGVAGNGDLSYEIYTSTFYVLAYKDASVADTSFSDTQLETLVKSLQVSSASSTSTDNPSATLSPLLQPTQ